MNSIRVFEQLKLATLMPEVTIEVIENLKLPN